MTVSTKKKGFVLQGLKLANVNELKREGKSDLTFVKVGNSETLEVSELLYFGDQAVLELGKLVGQEVDVYLSPSSKGFTVSKVEPV